MPSLKATIRAGLIITLSLRGALHPAQAIDEYVHYIWQGQSCYAVVTTVWASGKTAETKTYSCQVWNQILEARRAAEVRQKQAVQAARDQAQQDELDAHMAGVVNELLLELSNRGIKHKVEEIIKQDSEYRFFPDKVTRALNDVSSDLQTVDEFYGIFQQLKGYNPYHSRFIFNLADAINTMRINGYSTATLGQWRYKSIFDKCGKKGIVYFNTIEHNSRQQVFGVVAIERGGYVSAQELQAGRLNSCVFF